MLPPVRRLKSTVKDMSPIKAANWFGALAFDIQFINGFILNKKLCFTNNIHMNHFIKLFSILFLFTMVFGCKKNQETLNALEFVDPHIGGVGHLLQPTRPNVQLPNQVIRMHPVRSDYLDDQISFFPLTISSHRHFPLFGMLPGIGNPSESDWNEKQTYDHDLEKVTPYYYSTFLIDDNITVEFVPGNKAGYFRINYPKQKHKRLKLDIINEGSWEATSDMSITGTEFFS